MACRCIGGNRILGAHAPGWAAQLPAYGIDTLAALWLVERVVGFWPQGYG